MRVLDEFMLRRKEVLFWSICSILVWYLATTIITTPVDLIASDIANQVKICVFLGSLLVLSTLEELRLIRLRIFTATNTLLAALTINYG